MLFDDCISYLRNGQLSRDLSADVAIEKAMEVLRGEHVPNGYSSSEMNKIAYRILERARRRLNVQD